MLSAYLKGKLTKFDLPLHFMGSSFQQRVWKELLAIPYGSNWTYESLTSKLGDPKAIRAVAAANGANCLAVIVPCHRVIGKDGSLTGYAGGLAIKKRLLALEQRYTGQLQQVQLFD
jgi:methylated-DNA-[protein]-cysteine S-methyltransferase